MMNTKVEAMASEARTAAGSTLVAETVPKTGYADMLIQKKPFHYRFIKRAFDVIFSTCVIIAGFIPGAILSIFVAIDTKGSPIYSQERLGRDGKPFRIYKFRSMMGDSDNVEKYLTAEQLERWHIDRKVDNDPRITKLGRVLRRSSIDEFPQFINVFTGTMSTIGPRAITSDEIKHFKGSEQLLLSVTPGITGLWQAGRRNNATFDSGERQEIELQYVREASLLLDLKIFFSTFSVFISMTGR